MVLNYQILEQRYGSIAAFALLISMGERLGIDSARIAHIEPEIRFEHALAMNDFRPRVA